MPIDMKTIILEPFFDSMFKSVFACLVSVIMLVAAYISPWLNWFAWFAFVPFLLAVKGRKRLQMYALSALMTAAYLISIFYITDLFKLVPLSISLFFLICFIIFFTFLISEIQIISRRFSSRGWIIPVILWVIICLLINFFEPAITYGFFTYFSIIPVSHIIFQHIAETRFLYILLFVVLLTNKFAVNAILKFNRKQTCLALIPLVIFAGICGLYGGSRNDLSSLLSKDHDTVFRLEGGLFTRYMHFRKDGTYREISRDDLGWYTDDTDRGTWKQNANGQIELTSSIHLQDDTNNCFHLIPFRYLQYVLLASKDYPMFIDKTPEEAKFGATVDVLVRYVKFKLVPPDGVYMLVDTDSALREMETR